MVKILLRNFFKNTEIQNDRNADSYILLFVCLLKSILIAYLP